MNLMKISIRIRIPALFVYFIYDVRRRSPTENPQSEEY